MSMHRDPTFPSARVLLGDYAIRQNLEDRSQSMLNELMDTSFCPIHKKWKALWEAQERADDALNEARAHRYLAIQSLNQAIRDAIRALGGYQRNSSETSKGWSVHRCLDVLYQPAALELRRLAEHIRALEEDEAALPAPIRGVLRERYEAAMEMQRRLEEAERVAEESRRAREALDDAWLDAFNAYHRAVEFIAFSNGSGSREWIEQWTHEGLPSFSKERSVSE